MGTFFLRHNMLSDAHLAYCLDPWLVSSAEGLCGQLHVVHSVSLSSYFANEICCINSSSSSASSPLPIPYPPQFLEIQEKHFQSEMKHLVSTIVNSVQHCTSAHLGMNLGHYSVLTQFSIITKPGAKLYLEFHVTPMPIILAPKHGAAC